MKLTDNKHWFIPAGVAIPSTRLEVTEPNAIWLRDYQDNENLIDQAKSFLATVEQALYWLHEVAADQERDAEYQARQLDEFNEMCHEYEIAGGLI